MVEKLKLIYSKILKIPVLGILVAIPVRLTKRIVAPSRSSLSIQSQALEMAQMRERLDEIRVLAVSAQSMAAGAQAGVEQLGATSLADAVHRLAALEAKVDGIASRLDGAQLESISEQLLRLRLVLVQQVAMTEVATQAEPLPPANDSADRERAAAPRAAKTRPTDTAARSSARTDKAN